MASNDTGERIELPVIVGATDWDPEGEAAPGSAVPTRAVTARGRAGIAAAAVVALLAVVVVVAVAVRSGGDDQGEPANTAAPGAPSVAASAAESDPAAGTSAIQPMAPVSERSESVVGTITWQRYDGDERSLPARVEIDDEGGLVGRDDRLGWWRPVDDLSRWLRSDTIDRRIGADVWRSTASSPGLSIVTPAGSEAVDLAGLAEPLRSGFVVNAEPELGLAGGFPVELGGEVFLLASIRVGLPWESLADAGLDGAYRVRLSDGGRSIRAARGRFIDLPVEEFTLTPGVGGSTDIVDATGTVVWSFDAGPTETPLRAAAGYAQTAWLRWDGSRFEAIDRPWPDWHDVDMVRFGGGLLASSDGPQDEGASLWHTRDGSTWVRVALPEVPQDRTAVGVDGDGDEAIITLFARGGLRAWSTRDGSEFVRLPDVPGMARRSRGDFGWIAADPRSAPTLRVSPDGEVWESIDLSGLLDLDASRWDVSVSAAASGDRIVIVADRSGPRTVLVGHVES